MVPSKPRCLKLMMAFTVALIAGLTAFTGPCLAQSSANASGKDLR